jgi:hypothetical protein
MDLRNHGQTENIVQFKLPDATLDFETTGLEIYIQVMGQSGSILYKADEGDVEDISAIGTWAAPSTDKIRFAPTTVPHLYELHIANAVFAITGATKLSIHVFAPSLPDEGVSYEIGLNAPIGSVVDGIKKGVAYKYTNTVTSEEATVEIDDPA